MHAKQRNEAIRQTKLETRAFYNGMDKHDKITNITCYVK